MKNREKIEALFPDFRRALNRIKKYNEALERATADLDAFGKEETSGVEPDYNDIAAIQDEAVRGRQRVLCQNKIDSLEAQYSGLFQELRLQVEQAKPLVVSVLRPIIDRGIESATKSLRPYYGSDLAAEKAAKKTDAVESMLGRLDSLQSVGHTVDLRNLYRGAARLMAVLEEALKDGGDLMQFLLPKSG